MPKIVVVGAGPHALTACTYLLWARPEWGDGLTVVDPSGWLHAWRRMFARLHIPVLRSPGVHHPHPDPYALLHFAATEGRGDELVGSYQTPTAALFADFCADLVSSSGLDDCLHAGQVTAFRPLPHGGTIVQMSSGRRLHADHVIVATNTATPRRPAWADPSVVEHAADLRADVRPGERIAIIGGGLTAAQLALHAIIANARVTVLARRPLQSSTTDIDPGWLGRKLLEAYFDEADHERRAERYRDARRGTLPPAWHHHLRDAQQSGALDLREGTRVDGIATNGATASIATTAGRLVVDRVWLATGWDPDTRNDPLIARLHPATTSTGLPALDTDLRLPGTGIHLMGAAAGLQIGAAAPNIAGARIAAERILTSLTGTCPAQYPVPPLDGRRASTHHG